MIIKAIPSTWLIEEEHRLDCGPFVKGGIEARKIIAKLPCTKFQLAELTRDGLNGMYHVGQDKLIWADDSIHGVPFLGSTDILKADLSCQPFISRKQVLGNPLFQCPAGTTLITRSGTIGRMTFMRKDMVDMAISQDVLKVVPDPEKVLPGYLYAFLNSRFGIPIVTGGTFGSIIVHIEAGNISKLPVPRLNGVEAQAHQHVHQAAEHRITASLLIKQAIAEVFDGLGMSPPDRSLDSVRPSVTAQSSRQLLKRMDSFYYSKENIQARKEFDQASINHGAVAIGDVAIVWIPDIFKRQYVDNPEFGCPYFTGKDIYELSPTSEQFLKKEVAQEYKLLLTSGMILIQDSGQVSGLIGRPVMVGKNLEGSACTNNMVRLIAHDPIDNGFLFAILSTIYGTRLVKREASGSSIPHLEEGRIKRLSIPWPKRSIREAIGRKIIEATELRDAAVECEGRARLLVEKAIEEEAR